MQIYQKTLYLSAQSAFCRLNIHALQDSRHFPSICRISHGEAPLAVSVQRISDNVINDLVRLCLLSSLSARDRTVAELIHGLGPVQTWSHFASICLRR